MLLAHPPAPGLSSAFFNRAQWARVHPLQVKILDLVITPHPVCDTDPVPVGDRAVVRLPQRPVERPPGLRRDVVAVGVDVVGIAAEFDMLFDPLRQIGAAWRAVFHPAALDVACACGEFLPTVPAPPVDPVDGISVH